MFKVKKSSGGKTKQNKVLNTRSIQVSIAQWLRQQADMREVSGSSPGMVLFFFNNFLIFLN